MSWVTELLRDYPALSVAKERLALAEDRFIEAERKNTSLLAEVESLRKKCATLEHQVQHFRPDAPVQVPQECHALLIHLFKSPSDDHRHVDSIAQVLNIEKGMAQYYLDNLTKSGLATITHGNYMSGQAFYALTPKGRAYVAENKLL